MKTYSIVRFFESGEQEVLRTGLTLTEAQEWCQDPETSSKTASPSPDPFADDLGPWFDGYREET